MSDKKQTACAITVEPYNSDERGGGLVYHCVSNRYSCFGFRSSRDMRDIECECASGFTGVGGLEMCGNDEVKAIAIEQAREALNGQKNKD